MDSRSFRSPESIEVTSIETITNGHIFLGTLISINAFGVHALVGKGTSKEKTTFMNILRMWNELSCLFITVETLLSPMPDETTLGASYKKLLIKNLIPIRA